MKNFYKSLREHAMKVTNDNNYPKVRYHCLYTVKNRGAAHSICNLKYSTLKEIPLIFHNGLNYDYHFR